MKTELRYNYTGSYRALQRNHFGCGDWLSESDCRAAIAGALRSADVDAHTLRVVVQQKKSRWLPLRNGTVSEIFPDLVVEFMRERIVAGITGNEQLPPLVRLEVSAAVKRGKIAEALAAAELLVATLRQIENAQRVEADALLSMWAARCAQDARERQAAEAAAKAEEAAAEARRTELLRQANAARAPQA